MKASRVLLLALCATLVIAGAARELAASENAASSPKSCVALVNAFCKENQGFCDFLSAIFEIKNSNAFCKYLAEVSDGALWNCAKFCKDVAPQGDQGACVKACPSFGGGAP